MGSSGIEIWGGVECTVNRVDARAHDQVRRTGHRDRLDDLDRIASLGITRLRYPLLWEVVAPCGLASADWSWHDERLGRLRELGIDPIVTFVHHGSGPEYATLQSDAFASSLAAYAGAVARRYPWLRHFTPVNEPLTTARFNSLYGLWHPHDATDEAFIRAFLREIDGIARAMEAIRELIPGARLVQTEDLGKTYATSALADQAAFENERRWLTYDLLSGSFERNETMQRYFGRHGVRLSTSDSARLQTPLDLAGINYYVTSERFLDDRVERFPGRAKGGNGRDVYVDVEAARICVESTAGVGAMLRECWQRYGRPLAVTEAHLACTREEQLRWVAEMFDATVRARRSGVDVRAFTFWSLFGAYDWNSLLTRDDGVYESGAYDVRSSPPRPTAIAAFIGGCARGEPLDHPVLDGAGWWRMPLRLDHPPVLRDATVPVPDMRPRPSQRSLAMVGSTTAVGLALIDACALRNIECVAIDGNSSEHGDGAERAVETLAPWAVLDCRDLRSVEEGRRLAAACRNAGSAVVTFGSDRVFSGRSERPYTERHPADANDAGGRIEAAIETALIEHVPNALIIRTGLIFGSKRQSDPLAFAVRALLRGDRVPLAGERTSAIYIDDLVTVALDLLIDGASGYWHLVNDGATDLFSLANEALACAGVPAPETRSVMTAGPRLARVLASERGALFEPVGNALERCIREQRIAALAALIS